MEDLPFDVQELTPGTIQEMDDCVLRKLISRCWPELLPCLSIQDDSLVRNESGMIISGYDDNVTYFSEWMIDQLFFIYQFDIDGYFKIAKTQEGKRLLEFMNKKRIELVELSEAEERLLASKNRTNIEFFATFCGVVGTDSEGNLICRFSDLEFDSPCTGALFCTFGKNQELSYLIPGKSYLLSGGFNASFLSTIPTVHIKNTKILE